MGDFFLRAFQNEGMHASSIIDGQKSRVVILGPWLRSLACFGHQAELCWSFTAVNIPQMSHVVQVLVVSQVILVIHVPVLAGRALVGIP